MAVVAVSCSVSSQSGDDVDPSVEPDERHEIMLTKAEETIVKGNNTFAFGLLRSVADAKESSEHVFVSPLSAALAFGMLSNGAAGDTFDEIRRTFGFADISNEDINNYYLKIITELKAVDRAVALESANSIWINQRFTALDAFVKVNEEKYDAEVRNEDFSNPATLDLINAWCAEKTHGKIDRILNELSDDAVMCLLNALYFKGMWSEPFEKALTTDNTPFYNQDGSRTPVSMMHRELKAMYTGGEDFEMLELPYGNGAFSMMLLLPGEGSTVTSIAENLDATVWEDRMARMRKCEVELSFPRMSLEYEIELNEALKAMGMPSMFDEMKADFSRINPNAKFVVSKVIQKTTLDINEEGTEAAAVTAIVMIEMSAPGPPEHVSMTFDRPFLLFIKENSTGVIMFAGLTKKL
jgi:serpin B